MGGEAHIVAGQAHRPQEILFGPMDEASIHLGEGVVGAGEAESHRPVELTDPDTLLDCEVLGRTDEEEAAEGALELAGPELEAGGDIEVHVDIDESEVAHRPFGLDPSAEPLVEGDVDEDPDAVSLEGRGEIGRASCRERGEIAAVYDVVTGT